MKKSTKLITTAVALALVVAAMVVGIYAATSASASITASVSWTATAGITMEIDGGVLYSKAEYQSNGNKFSSYNNLYGNGLKMDTISINTTTTNAQASGISRNLNAEFCDDTDDGVNNPQSIIYWYSFNSSDHLYSVSITKIPRTTAAVNVSYYNGDVFNSGPSSITFSSTVITGLQVPPVPHPMLIGIKLTLINPDNSLAGFDAGVGFSISIDESYS